VVAPKVTRPDRSGGSTSVGGPTKALRGSLQSVIAFVGTRFDLTDVSADGLHDPDRRQLAESAVDQSLTQLEGAGEIESSEVEALREAALREAVGLGALEILLADNAIREVVIEGPQQVFADRGDGLKSTGLVFSTGAMLSTIGLRLVAQAGIAPSFNESVYRATLPYGPQVTVILPPVAVRGPVLEIRRMSAEVNADDLVRLGVLNGDMLELLRTAVLARRNIVVAGPAGSGVTTVLGAIASFIDATQRVVLVEDVPDLPFDREQVISLAAGQRLGGPGLGELVRQASKLRADRLVIDDVRGGELYDVFSVLSTRRPGNLVGVHAETEQALSSLPSLVRRGSTLSHDDAASLTAEVVQLLVALDVTDEGKPRVSRIVETTRKGKEREVHELWVSEDGSFVPKDTPSFSG
ncbi:MAG: CpaF family protein, partial [Myxococcales bacterium]|nr:CpaF family protein [Myxococcales bacterium]